MTAYAPSLYQVQNPGELANQQLSAEERDKLQEIHELINLLLRDLPVTTQATSAAAIYPAVPYSYSFLRLPCG
ncbi:MAG TPA: hypothetical protein VLM38_09460 [Blastocatellia bacterium]|nr:hypothetical protein [Blastocatellia bacterium]